MHLSALKCTFFSFLIGTCKHFIKNTQRVTKVQITRNQGLNIIQESHNSYPKHRIYQQLLLISLINSNVPLR